MPHPHTENDHGPTNPDVRFERSDIDAGSILVYGAIFTGLMVFAMVFIFIVGPMLVSADQAKKTDLPAAVTDNHQPPPEPRLEGIEDLVEWWNDRRVDPRVHPGAQPPRLHSPRAARALEAQEKSLRDKTGKDRPIDEVIDALADKLPARKQDAPASFSRRLPSKASSGRELPDEKPSRRPSKGGE